MRNKLLDKLTKSSLESGALAEEDIAIYRYGIINMGITFLYIITYIIIGVVTGNLWQLLFYLAAFTPLRISAGGYHMKHRATCYITTACIVAVTSIVLKNSGAFYMPFVWHSIAGAAYIVIMILAPVDTANKPYDEEEKKVFGKRTKILLQIEIALYILFSAMHYRMGAAVMLMSLIQVNLLLIFGKIDQKLHITD